MPLQMLGAACMRAEVDAGLAGGHPGEPAAYAAICHLYFDSIEAFVEAFSPHLSALTEDMPNYTDIEPISQISELKNIAAME